ncbi:hypothetical protein C8J55DRAFT_430091 [Lentinula edodes]|uniref:F-box domain-containing protein n=1 Tax=Lentinula lateritia TaxID=40482 RepID=A0A9W9ACI0_9AGAR|nr:hypothetical protein C8J55DRAFT_430091 [Lentinula edodes]
MRSSTVASQSPIHSLPLELLSYIFVLGAHSPPDTPDNKIKRQEPPPFNADSVKTPLVYSTVCRHWRTVALGTAALWANICITAGSMEMSGLEQEKRVNLTHLTSYLSLSKNYPLNILLDARDIDWDFAEPEISGSSDFSDYIPPFTQDGIRSVFSLLLPHLFRWRSIDILTDTWAPMHTALCMLNGPLMSNGAPLLESLTLMRCNDYISHSPLFQPTSMKSPTLFSSPTSSLGTDHRCLFPRLRNLTLRGVHVNWSSLAHSPPSLTSLELSSHTPDVRPTQSDFRELLSSCPKLKSLTVNGSGFISDDEELSLKTGVHNIDKSAKPIALPLLEKLKIGYRSAPEGFDILELVHAPNILQLSLDDATHPGEIDEVEADDMLLYVAGLRPMINPESSFSTPKHSSPFPTIQKLALKGLRAQTDTFRKLLVSTPTLQSLELYMMPRPMDVIHAMSPITTIAVTTPARTRTTYQRLLISRPASPASSRSYSCPCPRLQELCLWTVNLSSDDIHFIAKDLLLGRSEAGAGSLERLDIHLFEGTESASEDLEGTGVHIFKVPLDINGSSVVAIADSSQQTNLDEEFQFGGIFNDPIFDAQYSSSVFSH